MSLASSTFADAATPLVGSSTTPLVSLDTSINPDIDNKYKQLKIISSVVVVIVFLLVCGIGYFIYRRTCSSHKSRRHGVEMEGAVSKRKGKREYYDPFGVDTAELTVNSMTAIIGDEDEKTPWNTAISGAGGSKSSSIECDPSCSEDSKDVSVHRINTGKRVFQVKKVNETRSRSEASGQQVLLRLPKGFANAARSLQASNGNNFTLALVDKHSNTIHNIDLRRGRIRGRSPLANEGSRPQRVSIVNGKRRRMYSCGDAGDAGRGTNSSSNDELIHDSPDMPRKLRGLSISARDITRDSNSSLTDHSNTNSDDKDKQHSPSISSKETDDRLDSATHLLSPDTT